MLAPTWGDIMNIKRGLFRLWIVVSFLWVVLIVGLSWSDIRRDRWLAEEAWWDSDPLADLPVRCEEARGSATIDYRIEDAPEPWNRVREPSKACWYSEERFRTLWPEYSVLEHVDLSLKLYRSLGWEPEFARDPFDHTKRAAAFALIPPIAMLFVGSLFVWALSGFRSAAS